MTTSIPIVVTFLAGGPGARCAPGGEREGRSRLAWLAQGARGAEPPRNWPRERQGLSPPGLRERERPVEET